MNPQLKKTAAATLCSDEVGGGGLHPRAAELATAGAPDPGGRRLPDPRAHRGRLAEQAARREGGPTSVACRVPSAGHFRLSAVC
jgi:hypothetical protein